MATTKKPAKKPTAKKATAKKPVAKKPVAKKPTAKKTATKKPVAKKAPAKKAAKTVAKKPLAKKPAVRRPSPNEPISLSTIGYLTNDLNALKNDLEEFSAHMRPLDRRRLNGVGIKKQGFIERAYNLALENPEFLPHWLTTAKFQEDNDTFLALRNLFDLNKQIGEIIWNLTMQAADMAYTDALEFYASVREAAKRRVDAAESLHAELMTFFKSRGRRSEDEPTEAEVERDLHAILKGRKDGKIVVENVSPKLTGGTRKVVDETFKATGKFKDSEEGEITE